MLVRVEMTIETADYGEREFRREIEALIADIDASSKLIEFHMYEQKEQP